MKSNKNYNLRKTNLRGFSAALFGVLLLILVAVSAGKFWQISAQEQKKNTAASSGDGLLGQYPGVVVAGVSTEDKQNSKGFLNLFENNDALDSQDFVLKKSKQLSVEERQVPLMIENRRTAGVTFEPTEVFQPQTKLVSDIKSFEKVLGGGVVLKLDRNTTGNLVRNNVPFLNLRLPDGKGGFIETELAKVDIFAEGFKVETSTPNEKFDKDSLGVHYRGIIKGNKDSLVAISIFKNEVAGFISSKEDGNLVLGKIGGKNPENDHILYADKDLKAQSDWYCSTKDSDITLPESALQAPDSVMARCVRIYIEANYDLFQNRGSVDNTNTYVTAMFNQSATLFANDGIPVSISQIFVWTSASPFNGATSRDVLDQFTATRTSFNGDLAHLLTLTRNFGGIAWLNSLCGTLKYAVSDIDLQVANVPTYSWDVQVFTHETGHSLGSPHTHACAWNGNNTPIDGCGPTAGYPETNCSVVGPVPSSGGTIMSYCHLLSVGINFTQGFGPQPKSLILNRFNAVTCLQDCGTSGCSYSITPTSTNVAASGGTGTVSVTSSTTSCAWTAASNASWITVTSGASGTGNGTVGYSVAANTTTTARTGTITIAGQNFTVSQAAGSGACPATPITVGQTVSGALTTSDCIFTGTTRYVDLYSFSGTAGQQISVSMGSTVFDTYLYLVNSSGTIVAENDDITGSTDSRIPISGTFTLPAAGTYTIYATAYYGDSVSRTGAYTMSLAGTGTCSYSISPTSASVAAGGGSGTVAVTTTSGCGWTAASNASWITVTSGASGSGSGNVGYSVAANPATTSRTGTITIAGQTFTITQAAASCSYSLSPTSATVGSTGAIASFAVTAPTGCTWSAVSNATSWLTTSSSGNGNGSVTFNYSTNAGATRTGTISVGGQTYTLTQIGVSNPLGGKPFDFDGDRKSDLSIFRPGPGQWWHLRSSDGQGRAVQFGTSSDKMVPADYTGDGKTDIAFWRPSTGEWYIVRSEDTSYYAFQFGTAGDIPAPGDFDGDGKADPAIFRPSNSTWYVLKSTGGLFIQQFGVSGDLPVVADYDGDNKADVAIFRPSSGQWWLSRSTAGLLAVTFGTSTDKTVPDDYTGDGKADIAFWRPSTGEWYIVRSENTSFYAFPFGASTDTPAPGDFDNDGKIDAAVFRPSNSTWYILQTTAGFTGIAFGTTGDIPVPSAYVR